MDMAVRNNRAGLACLAGVITVTLWASAFVGIRAALGSYSPGQLVLLRFLVASIVLIGYACCVRMPLPMLRDVPQIVLLGLSGITIYNLALNYGETQVTAGVASFIVGTVPIWTGLISRFRNCLPGSGRRELRF